MNKTEDELQELINSKKKLISDTETELFQLEVELDNMQDKESEDYWLGLAQKCANGDLDPCGVPNVPSTYRQNVALLRAWEHEWDDDEVLGVLANWSMSYQSASHGGTLNTSEPKDCPYLVYSSSTKKGEPEVVATFMYQDWAYDFAKAEVTNWSVVVDGVDATLPAPGDPRVAEELREEAARLIAEADELTQG